MTEHESPASSPPADAGGREGANGLLDRIAAAWSRIRQLYRVLKIVRFSLLLGLVGVVAVFIAQGQEVLIAMAETGSFGQMLAFLVSAVLCGLSVWYCARVMFRFRFEENPASAKDVLPGLKEWLPRILGASVMVLTGVACAWAARSSSSTVILSVLAGALGLTAAGFLWLVIRRRHMMKRWIEMKDFEDEQADIRRFSDLPVITRAVVYGLFACALAMMVVVAYGYWWLGPFLGTASVVLLAAALIVPVGSAIVYWGNRYEVPALLLVLVWLIVCGSVADNHRVRKSAEMRSYQDFVPVAEKEVQGAIAGNDALREYIGRWLDDRSTSARPDGKIPLIVAAAEGGGIRAAYWTAAVLGGLHDEAAMRGLDFSRHLLAVSGVSGGSLGGAVFGALQRRESGGGTGRCAKEGAGDGLRERAHRVLAHDFLAPAVAVLLFTDLFQRFLPVAVFDDRGVALERAWERAWSECEGGNAFESPYRELWHGAQAAQQRPLLFLNSTVVETGQRMLITPFHLDPEHFQEVFADTVDGARVLGDQVPLSTAVHTSARFTYVSPAGTIQREEEMKGIRVPRWFRVVDGGYFENSGAVTASELLRVAGEVATSKSLDIYPIVVHISNEPEGKKESLTDVLRRWITNDNERAILPGLLSPLWALLNVRPGRGFQARDALKHQVEAAGGRHTHFSLRDQGTRLPLGWTLSSVAQCEMQHQLLGYPDAGADRWDNRKRLDAVLGELGPGSASGNPDADRKRDPCEIVESS